MFHLLALMLMTLRKLKVSLVSATENIDETPAGQLLHGVLASVNEFRSLADGEDIRYKMGQKARNGGTIGKAPVGYLNVREVYEGREVRTVVVDQERAPLVVMGFELFATGRYTLESLRKALSEAGFRTRATPKRPSKPVSLHTVGDMLRDRFLSRTRRPPPCTCSPRGAAANSRPSRTILLARRRQSGQTTRLSTDRRILARQVAGMVVGV